MNERRRAIFPLPSQPVASLLDAQPPEAQEAFQFLLATAMHKAGKFELLNVAQVDGQRRALEEEGLL